MAAAVDPEGLGQSRGTARAGNFVILRELVTKMKNGEWDSMILRKFAFGLV